MSTIARLGVRVRDWWFEPVPALRLRLFQRVFAATFLAYFLDWVPHVREWLTRSGFHLSAAAMHPTVPPQFPLLPEPVLVPFVALVILTTFAVILDVGGLAARVALLLIAVYIQGADDLASFTLNRFYVLGFLLLVVASPPRTVAGRTLQSAWPIRVIQATVVVVYCTAGFCKVMHGDWLTRPDVLLSQSVGFYRTAVAGWMATMLPPPAWIGLAAGALAFEVGAPLWFGVRRLRPYAILAGIVFHLSIAAMMKDLIFFSAQMLSFYVLFMSTARAARWERRIAGVLRVRSRAPRPLAAARVVGQR